LTIRDLEDFFPNKTVFIHFAGDFLPIAAKTNRNRNPPCLFKKMK